MRAFLVLVVLAAAAGGGWWWWSNRSVQAQAAEPDPAVLLAPPTLGPAEPPAAAKPHLDEGDRLWTAAGADPARAGNAPQIALAYSRALRALYGLPGHEERANRLVADRLTPLGSALFFAKATFPNDPTGTFATYQVKPGENPDKISQVHGMSRELLNRLRGRDPNDARLQAGQTLTVIRAKEQTEAGREPYFIHIDKSAFRLDLYICGIFARRYEITHGAKESPTPVGTSFITQREWHPQWTHPVSKKVLPYGDPENILGPIWLRFDSAGIGKDGIGIHGYTGADAQLGVMASNGCIRLRNDQAEELFQTLPSPQRAKTTVQIVD
jgi:lipoprotein-anchoring transpeptidase ErfK/SrfK